MSPPARAASGYDPILQPEGETRTCAELTADEKNAISHRGKAFRALVPVVRAAWLSSRKTYWCGRRDSNPHGSYPTGT